MFQPQLDPRHGVADLVCDKFQATALAFVVEKNARAGEQIVALTVVDSDPMAIDLGYAVG